MPDADLPPALVVGRTLSSYTTVGVLDRTLTVTYSVHNQLADAVAGFSSRLPSGQG